MKILFLALICSFMMCHAQEAELEIDRELSTKDSVFFSIRNKLSVPIYCIILPKKNAPKAISYKRGTLIETEKKATGIFRVPRNFQPHPESDAFSIGKYFSFRIGHGNPDKVKPNKDYQYLLPYKNFKKLIQGNFGRFSHNDHPAHYYAFDFNTHIGDTIYAARGGRVIKTKEDSRKYGNSKAFVSHANYVTIVHDDDTTASYVHLNYNGVLVKNNDIVTRGQAIGISGMTGFTTVPHLHFVVQMSTKKYGNVSIPIQFEGYIGKKLRKGYSYSRAKK
ncbi:M23 family metallopeptidase [uncultured Kordia sp.]|uniref:M23 family metallopeptidase n=1 Tax=uncultured Kordia sp. TaxID=507699 RepID=UPI00260E6D57|nr:M23 family metallopeptidase [uncultured Kordia sp.]